MFEHMLVPLDGSSLSEGVLPYAEYLARGLGARVILLSVVNPVIRRPPGPGPVGAEEREYLERQSHRLRSEGVETDSIVTVGYYVVDEIITKAKKLDCDLIAMATHGRTGLGQALLGSITHEVLHRAPIPVLVVRPTEHGELGREPVKITSIVVPLDGSELAEAVLPYVEDLAIRLSLEVILLQVVRARELVPAVVEGTPRDLTDGEVAEMSQGTEYLLGLARRLQGKGVQVRHEVLRGLPGAEIVKFARETPKNIVAMSSHGRSGLGYLVLGSVTDHVIKHSGDPVLVFRPPHHQATKKNAGMEVNDNAEDRA
jgi:nucleotide-binding universal stress UspA family protein